MVLETRTKEKIKEVLLNPDSDGPEAAYYILRGRPNITIWEAGKYGEEYVKTYGHYHLHNEKENYTFLFGEGVGVLQHRDQSGEVGEVRLVKVKSGNKVEIPAGWGHAFVNTGKTYLISSDDAPEDASHSQNDYRPIQEKRGMAYYIIEKDGKLEAVPNPNYKNLPEPEWVEAEKFF
ncbi:MAG: glucose-6-phosphate isomerase family protein [bacterium]|nr:glucose-6-phosphate isomerase family protein [bacterium]